MWKSGKAPSLALQMCPRRGWAAPSAQSHLAALPGRYPLAVTKYRESELCSSSIYNQNDPWDPPVVFEEFLQNNENIEEEVRAPPSSSPSPRLELRPVLGPVPAAPCCGESKLSGPQICPFLIRRAGGVAHPSPL